MIEVALHSMAVVGVAAWALICWVLRDGLGPDSLRSTGAVAFSRFVDQFWIAPVVGLALVAAALLLRRRRIEHGRSWHAV